MAEFKKYAPKLLQLEGGYTNHPEDLGGATNKGVTYKTYKEYCGQEKTIADLRNMLRNLAEHYEGYVLG